MRERGHLDLSSQDWRRLSAHADFWRLVDRKILKIGQVGRSTVRLFGQNLVGRAVVGDYVVDIVEKVPGTVDALIGHASGPSIRSERFRATAGNGPFVEVLAATLVETFVKAVRAYASAGREFEYAYRRQRGSLIGGRLDIAGTIRLRARGLRHLVAFDKTELTFTTDVNRVIAAALREAARLARVVSLSSSVLAELRAMSFLFQDAADGSALFSFRSDAAVLASRLAHDRPALRDLMSVAAVLLARESLSNSEDATTLTPVTWFLNMETLFERAVAETLRTYLLPDLLVVHGRTAVTRILDGVSNRYKAEPDLVVLNGLDRHVSAVGDVKYKVVRELPAEDDLYQLLTHTAAWACRSAFFVFPGDVYHHRDLGVSRAECRVRSFHVSPANLTEDMAALVRDLGLASERERHDLLFKR